MDSKNILAATVNRDRAFMLPLYITHIRPLLEYSSSLWNLGYVGDLKLLESVQRRWTKSIRGLEELEYAARLRALNLFSVKGRLLRHDITLSKFGRFFMVNVQYPQMIYSLLLILVPEDTNSKLHL